MNGNELKEGLAVGARFVFQSVGQHDPVSAETLSFEQLQAAEDWQTPPGSIDGPFKWTYFHRVHGHCADHHFMGVTYSSTLFTAVHLHITRNIIDIKLLATNFAGYESPWAGLTTQAVLVGLSIAHTMQPIDGTRELWISEPAEKLLENRFYEDVATNVGFVHTSSSPEVIKFRFA